MVNVPTLSYDVWLTLPGHPYRGRGRGRTGGAVSSRGAGVVGPLLVAAAGASLWVMAGAYFVAMFGLGLLSPLWETVVAEEVPEQALGRVRSFDHLISFASRPFGLAVAAPLAAVTGVTALALIGGFLVAAANLAAVLLMRNPVKASPGTAPSGSQAPFSQ
ncbi:hypothetical protein [Nonomuraea diastatica]|uniref:MFS transporter n=1 Tax=Nonomuraea diastatica TaxID=1848329 RepID=A0A4R4X4L1_9ACTN|nr:hypothetical protein [Nonomuraea diastatica]TDD25271.1 hypothetical protein E1294_03035 [Nonomuraea diastatica]